MQIQTNDKSESIVQAECLQLLALYNVYHWRQNTGAYKVGGRMVRSSSINGIADILGILPDGRFLAIECKREKGGIVSEKQKEFLGNIKKNNGVALVVSDSRQLEEFLKMTISRK